MNATAAVGFDLTSSLDDDTDYAMIDASNEAETCVSKSSVKNANYIQCTSELRMSQNFFINIYNRIQSILNSSENMQNNLKDAQVRPERFYILNR
jgi:hypothetical protein